jgi:hypothetical protein
MINKQNEIILLVQIWRNWSKRLKIFLKVNECLKRDENSALLYWEILDTGKTIVENNK